MGEDKRAGRAGLGGGALASFSFDGDGHREVVGRLGMLPAFLEQHPQFPGRLREFDRQLRASEPLDRLFKLLNRLLPTALRAGDLRQRHERACLLHCIMVFIGERQRGFCLALSVGDLAHSDQNPGQIVEGGRATAGGAKALLCLQRTLQGVVRVLQLPGVGDHMADRIETQRRTNGPFHKVNDLKTVKGVGPATVNRLRHWVEVEPDDDADPADMLDPPDKAAKRKASSTRKKAPTAPVDVNRASFEELKTIPGVGPSYAQHIIDERAKKPFEKVEDLTRVPGIKDRKLDSLRPYVTVGPTPGAIR